MRKVIGVMGGGVAEETAIAHDYAIGRLIVGHDFMLANGGRDATDPAEAFGIVLELIHGATP